MFPEIAKNDFYVTGESYAGKYVPAIAHKIHTLNPLAKSKINLKVCHLLFIIIIIHALSEFECFKRNEQCLVHIKTKTNIF